MPLGSHQSYSSITFRKTFSTTTVSIKMPLWQIHHPKGIFEDEATKKALVDDITKVYTSIGLPAFYVVVRFFPAGKGELWYGGKQSTAQEPFIRISIEHIAVQLQDSDENYHKSTRRINQALKAQVADKGYKYEFHVDETERRLWKVNGMNAPPYKSEEEKRWALANEALEWSGAWEMQRAPEKVVPVRPGDSAL